MGNMEDNKQQQPISIQIDTKDDLVYWCGQLCCTKIDLMDAITKVGTSYTSVDAYLEMNRKKISRQ